MGERRRSLDLRSILPKCFARGDGAPTVESLLLPNGAGLPAAALAVPRRAEFDEDAPAAELGLIPAIAPYLVSAGLS